jgi:hypothetical protein
MYALIKKKQITDELELDIFMLLSHHKLLLSLI